MEEAFQVVYCTVLCYTHVTHSAHCKIHLFNQAVNTLTTVSVSLKIKLRDNFMWE